MPVKPVAGRAIRALVSSALLAAAGIAGGGASCSGGRGGDESTPPEAAAISPPDARLLVVTDVDGHLEPCGCTSRPLGGVDRLVAAAERLGSDGVPTALVAAGNLWHDGGAAGADHGADPPGATGAAVPPNRAASAPPEHAGTLPAGASPVPHWNAETLAAALQRAGLRAVAPGPADRARGKGRVDALARGAAVLGMDEGPEAPGTQVHTIALGALTLAVVGVAPDAPDPVAAVEAALGNMEPAADRVVVLVPGGRPPAARIARGVPGVDLVVAAGLDAPRPLPPGRFGDAHVLNAGRQGQGILVVDLYEARDGARPPGEPSTGDAAAAHRPPLADRSPWSREVEAARLDERIASLNARGGVEAGGVIAGKLAELKAERERLRQPAPSPSPGSFVARFVELDPEVAEDAATSQLLGTLAKRVNEHNRTAYAGLTPPAPPPGDAAYVGSASCASCHQAAMDWWEGTPHGHAYATLVERDKQFHLECVGCHVTGYGRAGGATVTHLGDGNVLRNVGCESCHGPGSLHAAAPTAASLPAETPESVCVGCHNEEHSDLFVYEGYRAMLIAPGHGLPRTGPGDSSSGDGGDDDDGDT
jgi:hypothetical protein